MTTVRPQVSSSLGLPSEALLPPPPLQFEWPLTEQRAQVSAEAAEPIVLTGFLTEGQPDWHITESACPAHPGLPPGQIKRAQDQADTREESDLSREQAKPSPRLCDNVFCLSALEVKRHKDAKGRSYCRPCYQNYREGRYCDFCLQIYPAAGQYTDNKEWVACDFCGRWNHTECDQKQRGRAIAHSYECQKCEKAKSRPVRKAAKTVLSQEFLYEDVVKKKRCVDRVNTQAMPSVEVFLRGTPLEQSYGRLEQLFAGMGVRATASEEEVRRDVRMLSWALDPEGEESGAKQVKRQRRGL